MDIDVLLGLQWGDEGKGKVVDYLANRYDIVARFQGGPNAGHTLKFDEIKHVLHQIPSGIFRDSIKNLIGNGVVLDPVSFKAEIEELQALGIDPGANLYISKKTQLILPTHKLLDACYEKIKGKDKIGSTLKGIGPAYQDKIGRLGLRVGDILSPDFIEKYKALIKIHNETLSHLGFQNDFEVQEDAFFDSVEFLKTFTLVDSEYFIHDERLKGATILAEGAQGSLLDIDFGSYPFVTSSNTIVAGACTGLGVAPSTIGQVFGIFKSYCTRVGSGPFPTELHNETGQRLQELGNEFGATTGRPRRCGWLDMPALKFAVMLSGVTQLFMMKADVLNSFEEIKICTGYKLPNGDITDKLSYEVINSDIQPIFKSFKGWGELDAGHTTFRSLPQPILDYIDFIETETGVPVNMVSLGPDRAATIVRERNSSKKHINY